MWWCRCFWLGAGEWVVSLVMFLVYCGVCGGGALVVVFPAHAWDEGCRVFFHPTSVTLDHSRPGSSDVRAGL